MDKVSIIIPTYNRARLIGETLDSILEQTYQNWECIVVDVKRKRAWGKSFLSTLFFHCKKDSL